MYGVHQADLAQSFVPNTSFIGGVRLNASSTNGSYPEGVYVELYSGGTPPAGTLLGTTTTTVTGGGWFDFPFSSPITVTMGTPHHIRIFRASTTNAPIFTGDFGGNPYADGNFYTNPGFNSFPTADIAFEIIACPSTSNPEVPTLSEWGLIILALLLMTLGTVYLVQPKFRGRLEQEG